MREKLSLKSLFTLFLIFFTGIIVRMYSYSYVIGEKAIHFYGQDTYYHVRRVFLILANYPHVPRTDYYSSFPYGLHDPWPPAYDFFMATIAKIMGLTIFDKRAVELICAVTPVFFGLITLFFFYKMVSIMLNKKVALISTAILTVLPVHVNVTLFGRPDHHSIEPILFILLITFYIRWYQKFHFEVNSLKNLDMIIRHRIIPMLFFAFIVALLFLTWMGSVIFMGFMAICFLFQSVIDVKENFFQFDWWLYIFFSFIIAAGLMVPFYATTKWSLDKKFFPYYPTWFQLFVVVSIALYVLYLAVVGTISKKQKNWTSSVFIISLTVFLMAILTKQIFPEIYQNIVQGFYLLGQNDVWLGHVSESQPLFFVMGIFSSLFAIENLGYGVFIFPILLFIPLIIEWKNSGSVNLKIIFIFFWGAYFGIMALSSKRFTIYFGLLLPVLIAYFALALVKWLKKCLPNVFLSKLVQNGFVVLIIFIFFIPVITFYMNIIFPISSSPPILVIKKHNEDMMNWIKDNTPYEKGYYKSNYFPKYGIMSPNKYGHWITYIAQRPALFTSFAVHFKLISEVFLSDNVFGFSKFCRNFNVKYILLEPPAMMIPNYTKVLKRPQKYIIQKKQILKNGEIRLAVHLTKAYFNLVVSRLYELDGNSLAANNNNLSLLKPLSHFRLVHEANIMLDIQKRAIVPSKLFEYVKGAIIKGKVKPNNSVIIRILIQTNTKRTFWFIEKVKADSTGKFAIRVPYSTEKTIRKDAVTSLDKYQLYINKVFYKKIAVNELDINDGKMILLN